MSRHVSHRLMAYIDGQLAPPEAARVYAHLQSCRACRDRLTAYEGMARGLKSTLSTHPQASRADINRWWDSISRARVAVPRPGRIYVFGPALLIAVLISLPLMSALATFPPVQSRGRQVVQNTTATKPIPMAGLIPQPDQATPEIVAVATAAPIDESITAAPAPLAPATDR